MPNTNRYNTISPDDLKNPEAFRIWIKENLKHIYGGKNIPEAHLLICLGYIKRIVTEAGEIDNNFWLTAVRQLEANLKTIKRVEEKDEF